MLTIAKIAIIFYMVIVAAMLVWLVAWIVYDELDDFIRYSKHYDVIDNVLTALLALSLFGLFAFMFSAIAYLLIT